LGDFIQPGSTRPWPWVHQSVASLALRGGLEPSGRTLKRGRGTSLSDVTSTIPDSITPWQKRHTPPKSASSSAMQRRYHRDNLKLSAQNLQRGRCRLAGRG